MKTISIDRDWLIKKALEAQENLDREDKMGSKGDVALAAQALGRILMIKEIFDNVKQ